MPIAQRAAPSNAERPVKYREVIKTMLNLQGLVAASAVGQTGGDGSIVVALAILLVVVIVALVRKKRPPESAVTGGSHDGNDCARDSAGGAAERARPDGNRTRRGTTSSSSTGISERDAAIVMAITANAIGKPPAQLRFHSIKEVKEK